MSTLQPFIIMGVLIVVDIIILKIGLVITKAKIKTDMKNVALSFFIQFGLIVFISTPMIFQGSLGYFDQGLPPGLIMATILFSAFIDWQIINIVHKIGLKRAFIVVILIIGPMSIAMYLFADNIGEVIFGVV